MYQDIVRIERSIQNNTFESNPVLTKLFTQAAVETGSRLHLLGLLSDGGVHSHIDHLNALIRAAKDAHIQIVIYIVSVMEENSGQKSFMKYYEQLNDSGKTNKQSMDNWYNNWSLLCDGQRQEIRTNSISIGLPSRKWS